MEMLKGLDRRNVMMNELAQGRELAKQLQKLLDTCAPAKTQELLLDQILSTYNKALELAILNPPRLLADCSSDHEDQHRPSKKRKTLPRRIETVKVSTKAGEGPEDLPSDGYHWRKYGQKHILGAKFTRAYYRCTHRHSKGCLALKQVQRSDGDETLCQVIYVGDHTCTKSSHLNQPSTNSELPPVDPKPKALHHSAHLIQQAASPVSPQLKVKTEDLGDTKKFLFQSLSLSTGILEAYGAEQTNWLFTASPATTDSNHLPSSSAHMNGAWTPESDLHDGVSTPNSVLNSSFDGLEFTLDELGIDPNFPFDIPELLS